MVLRRLVCAALLLSPLALALAFAGCGDSGSDAREEPAPVLDPTDGGGTADSTTTAADGSVDDGGDAASKPKCAFTLAAPASFDSYNEDFRELHFERQEDCKFLIGGGSWEDNGYFSVVKATRRNGDVSKDTGFAQSGVFRHSFLGLKVTDVNATEASRAKAVRELGDKSIRLVGEANASLFMMKLSAGGALDPAFGSGGIATFTLPSGTPSGLAEVHIAADGSALLFGLASNGHYLAKATAAGVLDTTFATGGVYALDTVTNFRGGSFAVAKSGTHFFVCREAPDDDGSIVVRRFAVSSAMEAEVKITVLGTDAGASGTRVACGTLDVDEPQALRLGISYVQRYTQQLRNVGAVVSLDPAFASGATPAIEPIFDTTVNTSTNTSSYNLYPWPLHLVRAPDGRAYVASARVEPAADLASTNRKYKIVRLGNDGKVDATFTPIERSVFVISGNNVTAAPYALLFDDFGKMVSFFPRASGHDVRPEN